MEPKVEPAVPSRRIVIVGQFDRFANGVRGSEIADYLRSQGHDVEVVNTYYLSRASAVPGTRRNRLPHPSALRALIYLVEAASLVMRRSHGLRRTLSYPLLRADYLLRRRMLRRLLRLRDVDLLICVHPQDAGILERPLGPTRFYDCQTPYADEQWHEGRLTSGQWHRSRRQEKELYAAVDHLSFTWESYVDYVIDHYGYEGSNFCQLNWGCRPSSTRATYAFPPRVAYLGSLSSRFIDLPLLARLSAAYPHIDVYGGPPPDPALGLRYHGTTDPSILADYQFGLVTCTKDDLRRDGFSAKHMEYLSYGLPVLSPAWRRHPDRPGGAIAYTEDTFVSLVEHHSDPERWAQASDLAYRRAIDLTWDRTLEPLGRLLESLPARATA